MRPAALYQLRARPSRSTKIAARLPAPADQHAAAPRPVCALAKVAYAWGPPSTRTQGPSSGPCPRGRQKRLPGPPVTWGDAERSSRETPHAPGRTAGAQGPGAASAGRMRGSRTAPSLLGGDGAR